MRRATGQWFTLLLFIGLSLGMSGAGVFRAAYAEDDTHPVRILPLGDSITQADASQLGYRYFLWKRLLDAGMAFDFIGSMTAPMGEGQPSWPEYKGHSFDYDHEGHAGWTADDLLHGCSWDLDKGALPEWLKQYTPDIVLLHIGTNDVFHAIPIEKSIRDIESIIRLLQAANPKVAVYLAKIIPLCGQWAEEFNPGIIELNAHMDEIAKAMRTTDSQVIIVDQYTDFDAAQDTYDDVHPNASGEAKMARRWADALLYDGTPIPREDHYRTVQEYRLETSTETGVLANDYYPSDKRLDAALARQPQHGTVSLHANGRFCYMPEDSFTGIDQFQYCAKAKGKQSPPCPVFIEVGGNAPVGMNDGYATTQGQPLDVCARQGVLSNDVYYQKPSKASLAAAPQHGQLDLRPDGSFQYTPGQAYAGQDQFQYTLHDGHKESQPATVTIWMGHQSPVAWWKLDSGEGVVAVDASGGGHDGQLENMDASAWTAEGLQFDGKDDYVSIPPLNLNSNHLTITAWVKRTGAPPIYAGIVHCVDGDASTGLGLGSGPGWKPNHELGYIWNRLYWTWHPGLFLPDETWCFTALTVAPGQAALYLSQNGMLRSATHTARHEPVAFNSATRIGSNGENDVRFFHGCIRDVRIYDRTLTKPEIRRIAAGKP